MDVVLTDEANQDLREANDHYLGIRDRHGRSFDQAFEDAAREILRMPTRGNLFGEDFRRYRLSRFPYAILYATEPEKIVILAIMHVRRHPKKWEERTKTK